jgi:hypothetical protein
MRRAPMTMRRELQENAENYRHQHQDLRTEGGLEYGDTLANVDFSYLARVTATNGLAAASIALSPPPPANVNGVGAVTSDTYLSWTVAAGSPVVFLGAGGDQVAAFLCAVCGCLACGFGLFVPFVHLIPFALDHGVPQSSAVLLLGAVGVGSTAGRFASHSEP